MWSGLVDDVIKAAQKLIDSVSDDNSRHGGLLSRATTRASDELRLAISRYKAKGGDNGTAG